MNTNPCESHLNDSTPHTPTFASLCRQALLRIGEVDLVEGKSTGSTKIGEALSGSTGKIDFKGDFNKLGGIENLKIPKLPDSPSANSLRTITYCLSVDRDDTKNKWTESQPFTKSEKNKLKTIKSGAQKNVNADWSETDPTSSAYIKNKPSNTITTQSVTADWDETTTTSPSYIKNKPTNTDLINIALKNIPNSLSPSQTNESLQTLGLESSDIQTIAFSGTRTLTPDTIADIKRKLLPRYTRITTIIPLPEERIVLEKKNNDYISFDIYNGKIYALRKDKAKSITFDIFYFTNPDSNKVGKHVKALTHVGQNLLGNDLKSTSSFRIQNGSIYLLVNKGTLTELTYYFNFQQDSTGDIEFRTLNFNSIGKPSSGFSISTRYQGGVFKYAVLFQALNNRSNDQKLYLEYSGFTKRRSHHSGTYAIVNYNVSTNYILDFTILNDELTALLTKREWFLVDSYSNVVTPSVSLPSLGIDDQFISIRHINHNVYVLALVDGHYVIYAYYVGPVTIPADSP